MTLPGISRSSPVLAGDRDRNLGRFRRRILENTLCADWDAIRARFNPEAGIRATLALECRAGAGDTASGRSAVALIAGLCSGFRVVYKPRSLAVDVHFQEILAWLNARGDHPPFRTLNILERGSYGWVEFVTAERLHVSGGGSPFTSEARCGYLAILYALEATDFHFENVIASGEHPVLIDLESLFHPRAENHGLAGVDQTTVETMVYSVLGVGLLPQRLWTNAEGEGGRAGRAWRACLAN